MRRSPVMLVAMLFLGCGQTLEPIGPCRPTSCETAAVACGVFADGCGGTVDCGGCPEGFACGVNAPANACGPLCRPQSCEALGATCGQQGDGCGGVIVCGSCAGPEVCGGAGPNVCGAGACTPTTCAALGATCGKVGDGCGAILECGTCGAGLACGVAQPNQCGATCAPRSCADVGADCGAINDGCGATITCAACPLGQVCGIGGSNRCGIVAGGDGGSGGGGGGGGFGADAGPPGLVRFDGGLGSCTSTPMVVVELSSVQLYDTAIAPGGLVVLAQQGAAQDARRVELVPFDGSPTRVLFQGAVYPPVLSVGGDFAYILNEGRVVQVRLQGASGFPATLPYTTSFLPVADSQRVFWAGNTASTQVAWYAAPHSGSPISQIQLPPGVLPGGGLGETAVADGLMMTRRVDSTGGVIRDGLVSIPLPGGTVTLGPLLMPVRRDEGCTLGVTGQGCQSLGLSAHSGTWIYGTKHRVLSTGGAVTTNETTLMRQAVTGGAIVDVYSQSVTGNVGQAPVNDLIVSQNSAYFIALETFVPVQRPARVVQLPRRYAVYRVDHTATSATRLGFREGLMGEGTSADALAVDAACVWWVEVTTGDAAPAKTRVLRMSR